MLTFKRVAFADLTTTELFAIYKLRTEIFVVEQACAYQEVDDLDLTAQHLFSLDTDGQVLAYARIMDEGDQVRIGRVAVAKRQRGQGSGRTLVTQAIQAAQTVAPQAQRIVIQAQAYLQAFYASFGFEPVSDVYLDTGIPHLDMVLKISK
ncbi:N-acetyltransferase GCN5 [Levilactobacillus senmaizukei DSM 21775 = NBRC 103853]|uniref:N-acetyltransferase GCN5 n=1 Tax=Levilactobacillus senmaizukei DSM 21775 = NBRC 103853 TaxID=1423803 RepID=A0A0R2DGT6_9LACO|nr:GNAT family N-acetyltransferase [Levilactobacillus senmaizukei]KRN03297.1 N-acetyltransferase GCN5 [Levilactobacillus senmaizukei DSM 21775 = NBRC 103853]